MPVIDVHANWGAWPVPISVASATDINGVLARFDIERCMLSSVEAVYHDFTKGNQLLSEALVDQSRLLGYVTINPNYLEMSLEELKRYLSKERFAGVAFHTEQTGVAINAQETRDCLNACRRYDKPVLFRCHEPTQVFQLIDIAKEFQSLNFIITHKAGLGWKTTVDLAAEHFNLFVEPCSTLVERDEVRYAVEKMGDRRVLFGSNATLINPAFVAGMVRDAELTIQQKERVFYKNAKELFGL